MNEKDEWQKKRLLLFSLLFCQNTVENIEKVVEREGVQKNIEFASTPIV